MGRNLERYDTTRSVEAILRIHAQMECEMHMEIGA